MELFAKIFTNFYRQHILQIASFSMFDMALNMSLAFTIIALTK